MITFFVSGLPKTLSVGRSIRVKRAGVVNQFQTRRNSDWATLVGQIGREHAPETPLEGPLALIVDFELPRPVSAGKKATHPIKRPDVDNLVHKLSDQFNGCFYRDDSQIVCLIARKHYAIDGRTGVRITLRKVTG